MLTCTYKSSRDYPSNALGAHPLNRGHTVMYQTNIVPRVYINVMRKCSIERLRTHVLGGMASKTQVDNWSKFQTSYMQALSILCSEIVEQPKVPGTLVAT